MKVQFKESSVDFAEAQAYVVDDEDTLFRLKWVNPEIAKILRKKITEGKKASPGPGPRPKAVAANLHFTQGGSAYVLIVDSEISAFELQGHMRELFKDEPSGLTIDVRDQDLAARILNYAVSLRTLTPWKAETFGQRRKVDEAKKAPNSFAVESKIPVARSEEIARRAENISAATNLVRLLADLPGNELTPTTYRQRIDVIAKACDAKFEFLGQAELKKMGAGAFLAVAQADPAHACGIAHLHRPHPMAKMKLALVGKGLCFDTGGYNIKGGPHMYNMHRDMTGSAVALASFELLSRLDLPIEIHAYLALAENLISPSAFRPNDVVVACDGTSIEVIDTDAEGRMVLADTLALARKGKPDLVLDFATLTGACVRSLDTRRAAVFANRPELLHMAVAAGEASGERVWGFPIGEDYWAGLKSEVADIRQIASTNNSDHIYAATFLSHFIGEAIPWIHMDLAPDTNEGGLGLIATDTTGFGVRWMLELVENFAAKLG